MSSSHVGSLERTSRVALSLPILGAALYVLLYQNSFRDLEALMAQSWLSTLIEGSVGRIGNLIYFSWPDGPAIGLRIGPECTVALLIAPFFVVVATLVSVTRFRVGKTLLGLAIGSAMLLVVNQIRIALIAVSIQQWGMTGYDVSHRFIGTVVGLAGFTAALLVMVKIASGSSTDPVRRA